MNRAFFKGDRLAAATLLAASLSICGQTVAAEDLVKEQPVDIETSTSEIRVNVTGIKKLKGQITCSIYNDPSTFLKKGKKAMRKVVEVPSRDGVTCVFDGVTPGEYAITVSHDKNANNKMDSNFLGIPNEPWGVSNNARPGFRAPRWSEAVFAFSGAPLEIMIKVD